MTIINMISNINIKPIVTEKSLQEAKQGKYSFSVPLNMTKDQVKVAINSLFGVKVREVRTVSYKSVDRRNVYRKKIGSSAFKKAIVKLAKDQKIDIFTEKK